MKRKHFFLMLSILGVCYTWYYNIQWFQNTNDPTFTNFFNEAQANFAGKSFGADLTVVVVVVTFFVFMIPESLRLKIRYWWLLIPFTFLVAVAFTFPLFLYLRENALEKLKLSK